MRVDDHADKKNNDRLGSDTNSLSLIDNNDYTYRVCLAFGWSLALLIA